MEGAMKITVSKWGNSLAIRIPKTFAKEAMIEQGSEVDISIKDGKLVISPVRKRLFVLKDLLALISDENIHGEVDFGDRTGREVF